MAYAANPQCVKGVGWAEEKGKREEMEDGFVFIDAFSDDPKSGFFAIYDGHGGRDTVDAVCKHLHVNLSRELKSVFSKPVEDNNDISQAICDAFEKTDEFIIDQGHVGGAVVCMCLILDDSIQLHGVEGQRSIFTAHCGDARAVIARNGEGVRLTSQSDHKATDPGEQMIISKLGGQIVNERVNGMLAITRALGDPLLKKPRLKQNVVSHIPDVTATNIVKSDHFLIIACDGLWDVIEDQDAVDFVKAALEVLHEDGITDVDEGLVGAIIAKQLIKHSLALGTTDNVTCMIVFL